MFMSMNFRLIFPLLLLFGSCSLFHSEDDASSREQEYVGQMVEKTRQVIEGTAASSEFEQVIEFGRDTRYYPLVRGWVVQEITNTKSQLSSTDLNSPVYPELKEKLLRLERILRLIDLE
jgi:hypothetical protein